MKCLWLNCMNNVFPSCITILNEASGGNEGMKKTYKVHIKFWLLHAYALKQGWGGARDLAPEAVERREGINDCYLSELCLEASLPPKTSSSCLPCCCAHFEFKLPAETRLTADKTHHGTEGVVSAPAVPIGNTSSRHRHTWGWRTNVMGKQNCLRLIASGSPFETKAQSKLLRLSGNSTVQDIPGPY